MCVQTSSLNLAMNFRNLRDLLENGDPASMDVMLLVESLRTKHHLKEKPFYDLLMKIVPFMDILHADGVPSHKTIKKKMSGLMVGVTITFVYRHKETGRLEKHRDMEAIPKKKFKPSIWALVYTIAKEEYCSAGLDFLRNINTVLILMFKLFNEYNIKVCNALQLCTGQCT